jgi:hypothetical protein
MSMCVPFIAVALMTALPAVAQPVEVKLPMPRTPDCKWNVTNFGGGGPGGYRQGIGTIAMSNDGKWCYDGITNIMYGERVMPDYKLTENPKHGSVAIVPIPEPGKERTRIGYKPNPGFSGQDTFEVTSYGFKTFPIPFTVTVKPAS